MHTIIITAIKSDDFGWRRNLNVGQIAGGTESICLSSSFIVVIIIVINIKYKYCHCKNIAMVMHYWFQNKQYDQQRKRQKSWGCWGNLFTITTTARVLMAPSITSLLFYFPMLKQKKLLLRRI